MRVQLPLPAPEVIEISNQKFKYLKFLLCVVIIILTLIVALIAFFIIREPYENDHMPQILTDKVNYERVNEREYFWSSYKDGLDCGLDQLEKMVKELSLSTEINEKYYKCYKFILENGTIYWIQPTDFIQYLILEKPEDNYQLILSEAKTEYPGPPDELSVRGRGDSKSVIFRYEGHNNPRKILRLTIKD